MGYIYKISNTINNKKYIGKTSNSIEYRWKQHLYSYKDSSKKHYHLYAAMNKYGIDNFFIEEVGKYSEDSLNYWETYWIKYYDSYNNGYNMTLGGDGTISIDRNRIYSLWEEGYSIRDISDITKHDRNAIHKILENYYNFSNEESIRRGVIKVSESKEKELFIYKEDNSYEKTTVKLWCHKNMMSPENVRRLARENKVNNNLLYSYLKLNEEQINYYFKHQKNKKAVNQYTLEGKFLRTYNSIIEAKNITGINNISKAAKNPGLISGGFQWRYYDEEKSTQNIAPSNISMKKKVEQYSKEGEYIQTFNSISEAARCLGMKSSSNISQVCRGKLKTSGGYIWRYTDG